MKPRARMAVELGKYATESFTKYPYDWGRQTIISIIRNREYLGHIVCNKHASKSFKDRRLIEIPEDQWIEVKNMHEPIVDEETFEKAQKMAVARQKPVKETGTHQIFIGLLICADCGRRMTFQNRKDKNQFGSYACGTFRTRGKAYCSMHYINYDNLYKLVLGDIRKHAKNACIDSEKLLSEIAQTNDIKSKKYIAQLEREILKSEKRFEDLNLIIKRLYEDNVIGKLSDERFMLLSKDYENEQKTLKESIIKTRLTIEKFNNSKDNSNRFAEIVKKYSDIKELDEIMLNELIEKIVIHERKFIDGKEHHGCRENRKLMTQQVDIYYNFVGNI